MICKVDHLCDPISSESSELFFLFAFTFLNVSKTYGNCKPHKTWDPNEEKASNITKMNSHSAQNVLLTKKNAEKTQFGEIWEKISYAEIACAIPAYLRTR